jgi:hypothetical protein
MSTDVEFDVRGIYVRLSTLSESISAFPDLFGVYLSKKKKPKQSKTSFSPFSLRDKQRARKYSAAFSVFL